jgi:hypothetical protein
MPFPSALALIRHNWRRWLAWPHGRPTPALDRKPATQHRPSSLGRSGSVSVVRGVVCFQLRGLPGRRGVRTGRRSRSEMARSMRPSSSCSLAMISSRSMNPFLRARGRFREPSSGRLFPRPSKRYTSVPTLIAGPKGPLQNMQSVKAQDLK